MPISTPTEKPMPAMAATGDPDTDGNADPQIIKEIQFRSRFIRAPAQRIHDNRFVFVLDISPNPIAAWLSLWIPRVVRSWLERLLPEWFLPASVILKERNPEKANFFDNEIAAYRHLQPLQGNCIPRMFGEVSCYDHHDQIRHQMISKRPIPAMLLEKVEGKPLYNLPTEDLESPGLLEELKEMYNQLTKYHVVHGDPTLANFHRVGKRIVALDLEFSYFLPSDIKNEDALLTLEDLIKYELERREEK